MTRLLICFWLSGCSLIAQTFSLSELTFLSNNQRWFSQITINNVTNSASLTNYQVKVTVPYDSRMQPDFDDVRFLDSDRVTQLDYWLETKTNSVSALFWLEVPIILGSSLKTNYIIYGNSWAASASNGANTFVDFIDNEVEGWEKSPANPIIAPGASGSWEETSVYAQATIERDGTNYLFYTASPAGGGVKERINRETSVGLATFTSDPSAPVKHPSNPIIARAGVGLGGTNEGIAIFDVKLINGTNYLFLSKFDADLSQSIAMMESVDLLNWTNLTVVLSGHTNDHAPFVMENPTNSTLLIMYFSYHNGGVYQIGRATASKAAPYVWTEDLASNPVLTTAGESVIYPFVEYSSNLFTIYYGNSQGSGTNVFYKTYRASSTNGTSFTHTGNVVFNLGAAGQWDDQYAHLVRKYSNGSSTWINYTARDNPNYYVGIGLLNPSGANAWDAAINSVFRGTNQVYTGSYGRALVGGGGVATLRPTLEEDVLAEKNHSYELWIYDDLITTTNFQNMVRLHDTGGVDPLVGIWTPTSTTKYVYRAEGGAFTASAINRTAGWHRFSFRVGDSTTGVYVDDSLIFTETGLNENSLDVFKITGHDQGIGYIDTYIARKYSSPEPVATVVP